MPILNMATGLTAGTPPVRPPRWSAPTALRRRLRAWRLCATLAAVAFLPLPAHAVFAINDPWVKAAPDARVAEAYMELRSSEGTVLVGVKSAAATGVAIRAPGAKGPPLAELPLPAGITLLLAPNQYRFALSGLARPLKRGDRVPLVLTLRAADGSEQEVPISAEVRKRSSRDDHKGAIAH